MTLVHILLQKGSEILRLEQFNQIGNYAYAPEIDKIIDRMTATIQYDVREQNAKPSPNNFTQLEYRLKIDIHK